MLVTSGNRWVAAASALALVLGLLAFGPVESASARTAHDVTSVVEKRRVDSVPTPRLSWYRCFSRAECTTVKLPVDYDTPRGAKTELALLRLRARDQRRKIGTLFLNPGGPGGSGVFMALDAPYFLSPELLDRFDIVGMDPRGTNFSDQVRCFPGAREAEPVLEALTARPFPYTAAEERSLIRATRAHARACSTTGRPLSLSASTAQVARDLDVLRRAVGDRRLTYLGFSYGSYLGEVYANMFPDRVRSVAIDGVLDPTAWAGTPANRSIPVAKRLKSAEGATRALREIFQRCDAAGKELCSIAGDSARTFEEVAERLKADPLVEVDPFTGEELVLGYAELVGFALGALYSPYGYADIDFITAALLELTGTADRRVADGNDRRAAALRRLVRTVERIEERPQNTLRRSNFKRSNFRRSNFAYPYDNQLDAFSSIACTDSLDAPSLSSFPLRADAADRGAAYFGRAWLWALADCASPTWTGDDEDAYRGSFRRRTVSPVLVVGNYWDPATSYSGAVRAAQLLPNSRLLSSDSWGHTAYGSSGCVTGRVDRYLLAGTLPASGTVCTGDVQPFAEEAAPEELAEPIYVAPLLPVAQP